MPYQIARHSDDLLWVVMEGQLALEHAERYFCELWELLDGCPSPTDLLVDGRSLVSASPAARRRTEQVAHHPHLGHLAFVVSEHHLLLFAPFVKLVSGIGLFGNEHDALAYLRTARSLPTIRDAGLPTLPPPPTPRTTPAPERATAPPAQSNGPPRPLPPPRTPVASGPSTRRPAPDPSVRVLHTLTDIVDGWTSSLLGVSRRTERDK
ncbi:MAG: hypothetical protein OHK0015_33300 [Chloroflexi bacterium OHK40]